MNTLNTYRGDAYEAKRPKPPNADQGLL